ncbi:PREDICTED: uncharacterized protein LOC109173046 [Ipomoea nil]|uniref:uncharacterized protein LOC109173046 n=1 Tax=Ipomoea nil TaxID=35883 RepID=UPI000900BE0B|nr:PREDICTED: uncharacterized protein LOC109173046 [Ipomoea nil]
MDESDKHNSQEEEEEEEELETISLNNFPTTITDAPENDGGIHDRRLSSDPVDLFEFFSDFTSQSEISHAEEIIFCGKVMALKGQAERSADGDGRKLQSFHGRRCESLSIPRTNSGSKSGRWQLPRSSRSLDYKKLRRNPSLCSSEVDRSSSSKPDVSAAGLKPQKPRWYALMFGHVKFPPEMDLRDIKNRQVRRTVSPMFHIDDRSSSETGRNSPSMRNERKSSWDFIKMLSCKDHASVAVTTSSFDCISHA